MLDGPWLEPIEIYDAIGSGQILAKLVLKQQSRAPNSLGQTLCDISLRWNTFIDCLTINEIKSFNVLSGGSTRVAIIINKGLNILSDDKVKEFYDKMVSSSSIDFE